MPARALIGLLTAIVIGLLAGPVKSGERGYIDLLIQYYADYYDVPVELVHRVVQRESTYNPRARNGPYWGLMQILPETARTMGFRGRPEELLDPETNLIYAVKYLRGAYIVADGNHDRAVQHYARGYYYDARDRGLLEETGLRPGPRSPVAPPPPAQVAAAQTPPAAPARVRELVAPVSAAPARGEAEETRSGATRAIALGFLPPPRPADLAIPASESPALAAIKAAEISSPVPAAHDHHNGLEASILAASSYMSANPAPELRPSMDMLEATFSVLDRLSAGSGQELLLP